MLIAPFPVKAMFEFTLNGRPYSSSQLLNFSDATEQAALTPYEVHTLYFCKRWLSGQSNFFLNTSGSTGRPKTVMLTRTQLVASAGLTQRALGLRSGDRTLVCLSTDYIAGMMMLVRGFELGLSLTVMTPTRNPLAAFADDVSFEFTAFTPLQLQEVITHTPSKVTLVNRMRAILLGGAPVSADLLQKIKTLAAPVYHTYGMTETASHIALKPLNGPRANDPQASDYYRPLEGVEIGLSCKGCLTVKSSVTRHRTLITNDLVDLKANGLFRWLGRIDNVINSGGIKVQAEKVEQALETLFQDYPGNILIKRRFFVGPVEHSTFGQMVVAVMEGPPVPVTIQDDIRTRLLQSKLLEKYEIPRYFYFRSHLLETPTGKIDRQANLLKIIETTDPQTE